jgi:hypothetical protein
MPSSTRLIVFAAAAAVIALHALDDATSAREPGTTAAALTSAGRR